MTTTLILVILVGLIFDFVNGWNDSANAIATVVSTRVLSPLTAVIFAAILNFVGAFLSVAVAKTIGKGLVDPSAIVGAEWMVMAAMFAAALWVGICTYWGLPVSGSHSLIGGLIGAAIGAFGTQVLIASGIWKVLIAMLVSPLIGLAVAYVFLIGVYWIASRMSPRSVRQWFSPLQVVSAGFMALTHGMNDAQKVMGVITMALIGAAATIPFTDPTPWWAWDSMDAGVPLWVMAAAATVMGLGTYAGGWKVIRTLGQKLAHIRPIEGFVAETAAGIVLTGAAGAGIPVSTTHTITGSILGVGAASRGARSVRWGIGTKILWAWVLTLPATVLLGGVLAMAMSAVVTPKKSPWPTIDGAELVLDDGSRLTGHVEELSASEFEITWADASGGHRQRLLRKRVVRWAATTLDIRKVFTVEQALAREITRRKAAREPVEGAAGLFALGEYCARIRDFAKSRELFEGCRTANPAYQADKVRNALGRLEPLLRGVGRTAPKTSG